MPIYDFVPPLNAECPTPLPFQLKSKYFTTKIHYDRLNLAKISTLYQYLHKSI